MCGFRFNAGKISYVLFKNLLKSKQVKKLVISTNKNSINSHLSKQFPVMISKYRLPTNTYYAMAKMYATFNFGRDKLDQKSIRVIVEKGYLKWN